MVVYIAFFSVYILEILLTLMHQQSIQKSCINCLIFSKKILTITSTYIVITDTTIIINITHFFNCIPKGWFWRATQTPTIRSTCCRPCSTNTGIACTTIFSHKETVYNISFNRNHFTTRQSRFSQNVKKRCEKSVAFWQHAWTKLLCLLIFVTRRFMQIHLYKFRDIFA